MSPERSILTPDERAELEHTVLHFEPLGLQYADRVQAHETASLGMWVFLATEVMLFGALFTPLGAYHFFYPEAFEKASARLNWQIGGINTVVLLVSSLCMVLAVHSAQLGQQKPLLWYLALTAGLGVVFLLLKALEYYLDYREYLIPGWRFNPEEWVTHEGLRPEEVPHVELFLLFYWIMTALHGVHVLLGIILIVAMFVLARRGFFSPDYYTPVDLAGLYWHFVDTVWVFLLPMLYLLGTHTKLGF
jgi:cytochrome c oxidase subunit 3